MFIRIWVQPSFPCWNTNLQRSDEAAASWWISVDRSERVTDGAVELLSGLPSVTRWSASREKHRVCRSKRNGPHLYLSFFLICPFGVFLFFLNFLRLNSPEDDNHWKESASSREHLCVMMFSPAGFLTLTVQLNFSQIGYFTLTLLHVLILFCFFLVTFFCAWTVASLPSNTFTEICNFWVTVQYSPLWLLVVDVLGLGVKVPCHLS